VRQILTLGVTLTSSKMQCKDNEGHYGVVLRKWK